MVSVHNHLEEGWYVGYGTVICFHRPMGNVWYEGGDVRIS